jgi:hypothetical protein
MSKRINVKEEAIWFTEERVKKVKKVKKREINGLGRSAKGRTGEKEMERKWQQDGTVSRPPGR